MQPSIVPIDTPDATPGAPPGAAPPAPAANDPTVPGLSAGAAAAVRGTGASNSTLNSILQQYQPLLEGMTQAGNEAAGLRAQEAQAEQPALGRMGSAVEAVRAAMRDESTRHIADLPPAPDMKMKQMGAGSIVGAIIMGALVGRGGVGSWNLAAMSLGSAMKNWREGEMDRVQGDLDNYKLAVERVKYQNDAAEAHYQRAMDMAKTDITLAETELKLASARFAPGIQAAMDKAQTFKDKADLFGKFIDMSDKSMEAMAKVSESASTVAKNYAEAAKARAQAAGYGTTGANAEGDLMAAIVSAGTSLPTGVRSDKGRHEVLQALLRKYPDETPDQIAQRIANGQIDFAALKKETGVAATQAGRVAVSLKEMQKFVPLVRQTAASVPTKSFVPFNKLSQMSDTELSANPSLGALRIYLNGLLNAYDGLAARGGIDKEKRAKARSLISEAQSPEVLNANLDAFMREAQVAESAAQSATTVEGMRGGGEPTYSAADYAAKHGIGEDEARKLLTDAGYKVK